MKKFINLFSKVSIALVLMLYSFPMYNTFTPEELNIEETKVSAVGTAMSAQSYFSIDGITSKYKIPYTAYEKLGTNAGVYNNREKLYPKDTKVKENYWGSDLPFALVDPLTNETYVGYCAQSYANASNAMTVKGQINDPKILKLTYIGSGTTTHYPSLDRQIAIQIVLWGALNYDWRSDMFSGGWISLNADAYIGMSGVREYVQEIADNWAWITNSSIKSLVNIEPRETNLTGYCHENKEETHPPLFEVNWKFLSGDNAESLDSIADITYTGANITVYKGSDPATANIINKYGLTPKPHRHYLLLDTTQQKGSVEILASVEYKNDYKPLNELILVTYGGATKNQPFIMPLGERNNTKLYLNWECLQQPPSPPEVVPTEGSSLYKDLRWFNMPLAFGEIKAGKGSNLTSKSTEGKYATNRSYESYDVLTGIPSTERLYVNLGGTEGYIDVAYKYVTKTQKFTVSWASPWRYTYKCGKKTCVKTGTNYFSDSYNWTFNYMHLDKASFRPLYGANVSQQELDIRLEIKNNLMDKGSYILKPNAQGLQIGPGVGIDKYNSGATISWNPAQGRFDTSRVNGRQSVKSDRQSQAHKLGNAAVGNLFAQNDALSITINGETYVIVPDINKQTAKPYTTTGNYTLDATGGQGLDYFKPRKDKWDVWSKIPITGYTGNPTKDNIRNLDGTPMLLEDYQLMPETRNGLYEFETNEDGNRLNYEKVVTVIKGGAGGLNSTVAELSDGENKGTTSIYTNSLNPVDANKHIEGNYVNIQYTNWQYPGTGNVTYLYAGKKPNGNKDTTLTSNPTYRSLNPIIIHNPTTALYSWVHDVNNNQLQDQRIKKDIDGIESYTANDKTPRTYVDFDFKVSIPNKAAFNTYWGQTSITNYGASFTDADHTKPGTLGKGYSGTAVNKNNNRDSQNPYSSASGLDVSKWINAKYIKFPFEVYYYKNSSESGGDGKGFYEADTWIKLYDDSRDQKSGDVTEFNFHVSSGQKDLKNGLIYIVTEAINSPESLVDNPDKLYLASEQYVNGTRNTKGTSLNSYSTVRDAEATYSSSNIISVDTIGRIGNLVVSNSNDPAWDKVFNPTDSGVSKARNYGMSFNMFESTVYPLNHTGGKAYDRFETLSPYLNESTPLSTLPVTTNFLTKGKNNQTIKLGYSIGGSLQTLGDYDYSVELYPMHQLSGNFKTGTPSNPFLFLASNPYQTNGTIGHYYNSKVHNSLQGGDSTAVSGAGYAPTYKHNITASLADPTMKLSAWEKASTTYQTAIQKGTDYKTVLGTPSKIVIPKELRTLIGKDTTNGRFGLANENGNNAYGSKNTDASSDCLCSYQNAQKWNWTFSMPQNTKIWFNTIASNKKDNGSIVTETPSSDQYIVTSFAARTKSLRTQIASKGISSQENIVLPAISSSSHRYQVISNSQQIADWDLTIFTNTGANGVPNIAGSTRNLPTGFNLVTVPNNNKGWDYSQSAKYSSPRIPVVWWDYSNQSTTDEEVIGTH